MQLTFVNTAKTFFSAAALVVATTFGASAQEANNTPVTIDGEHVTVTVPSPYGDTYAIELDNFGFTVMEAFASESGGTLYRVLISGNRALPKPLDWQNASEEERDQAMMAGAYNMDEIYAAIKVAAGLKTINGALFGGGRAICVRGGGAINPAQGIALMTCLVEDMPDFMAGMPALEGVDANQPETFTRGWKIALPADNG